MVHKALYASVFALFALTAIVSAQSNQKTLPASVVNAMATREERHHHFLWHNIRDTWNNLSATSQKEITALGWAPPRPSRRYDAAGNAIAITDNGSGEDFLYMHRQMIAKVNGILSANNETYGKIKGWTSLPAPGDKDWPVPANYTVPNNTARTATINKWKTVAFYNQTILPLEKTLTNTTQLKNMTLSELGSKIEVTLHSYFHLRHSSASVYGYRPSSSGGLPVIDKKWDDPKYDWLVDTYSSHVNPAFWKIHGWVDDRIEDWRKANGLSSIRWNGTWQGGPMSSIAYLWNKKETTVTTKSMRGSAAAAQTQASETTESMEMNHDVMQQVVDIFLKEGKEVSFADPVFLESPMKATSLKPKRRLCKRRATRKAH